MGFGFKTLVIRNESALGLGFKRPKISINSSPASSVNSGTGPSPLGPTRRFYWDDSFSETSSEETCASLKGRRGSNGCEGTPVHP